MGLIWKGVKAVARAAIAQPWDYQGDGAPGDWEFRVSPDEQHFAVFAPGHGRWMILDARLFVPVAEVARLDEMDDHTEDWRQFLSTEDPDDV